METLIGRMIGLLALMAVALIGQLTYGQLDGITLLLMCNRYTNKKRDDS